MVATSLPSLYIITIGTSASVMNQLLLDATVVAGPQASEATPKIQRRESSFFSSQLESPRGRTP